MSRIKAGSEVDGWGFDGICQLCVTRIVRLAQTSCGKKKYNFLVDVLGKIPNIRGRRGTCLLDITQDDWRIQVRRSNEPGCNVKCCLWPVGPGRECITKQFIFTTQTSHLFIFKSGNNSTRAQQTEWWETCPIMSDVIIRYSSAYSTT